MTKKNTCSTCGATRTEKEFCKGRNLCKECRRTYFREYKRKHPDWPLLSVRGRMISRCYTKTDKAYEKYGGRGICVCDEWRNSVSAFVDWSKSNGYKVGLDIDRINNNGNYSPDNCRWANRTQQMRNTSRTVFTEKDVSVVKHLLGCGLSVPYIAGLIMCSSSAVAGIALGRSWKDVNPIREDLCRTL